MTNNLFKLNLSDIDLPTSSEGSIYEIEQAKALIVGGDLLPEVYIELSFLLHLSAFVDRKGIDYPVIAFLGKKLCEEVKEAEDGSSIHLSFDGSEDNETVSVAIVSGLLTSILTGDYKTGMSAMLYTLASHFAEGARVNPEDYGCLTVLKLLRQFGRYNDYFYVMVDDTGVTFVLESSAVTPSFYKVDIDHSDLIRLFAAAGIELELECLDCSAVTPFVELLHKEFFECPVYRRK